MTAQETGVTPVYPFTVANGQVMMTSDPAAILQSMVVFCMSTQVGERVMRPEWGVDVLNSYLALGAALDEAVREAVEEAFRKYFPGYIVRKVESTRRVYSPTWADVTVQYGTEEAGLDREARVSVLMPGGNETPYDEGTV